MFTFDAGFLNALEGKAVGQGEEVAYTSSGTRHLHGLPCAVVVAIVVVITAVAIRKKFK